MKQSQLFSKTLRETPKDEEAINARILSRAGFINKLHAGVYTYLPLGLRVLNKIEGIVREEMSALGAEEFLMPALHPKEPWEKTKRWHSFDALYRLQSRSKSEFALGPTHEEVLYPLLTHYIASYHDLPIAVYQIQTKFRDEARAKSGLLRGREFRMKDLYSFHAGQEDRDRYYDAAAAAYKKIFKRLGLDALETKASGGTFSEESLEFQVACPAGEDTIFFCLKCRTAVNKELVKNATPACEKCGGSTEEAQSIEVGNIFPLKDQYAKDFGLTFKDKDGSVRFVSAGCFGLGTSRVMGTLVEVFHDEKGVLWPEAVAPFKAHVLEIGTAVKNYAAAFAEKLHASGIDALYDDRDDKTPGEKFADADLIGIPWRIVISEKTRTQKKIEVKARHEDRPVLMDEDEFFARMKGNQ